jgi:hypothetical protein
LEFLADNPIKRLTVLRKQQSGKEDDEAMDWDVARLVSNIFISFIGAGILGLPYAFRKSGLLQTLRL